MMSLRLRVGKFLVCFMGTRDKELIKGKETLNCKDFLLRT